MSISLYSSIDASLNRALEGLRVCEDIFRFSVRNPISSEFKTLRHIIAGAVSDIPAGLLLSSRDVAGDTQKFIETGSEVRRENLSDVFRSNMRRVAEAVRSIEEISKVFRPALSVVMQNARFTLYDLEKKAWSVLIKDELLKKFRFSLCAILDPVFVPHDKFDGMAEILAASGADIIQLRMRNSKDRIIVDEADKIAAICRKHGILFIVDGRVDVALVTSADGIHLGRDDILLSMLDSFDAGNILKGVSVESKDQASMAWSDGADYIVFDPRDTDPSYYSTTYAPGVKILTEICSGSAGAVVAAGSIDPGDIKKIIETGGSAVAVSSYLYKDGLVPENTRRISDLIHSFR